MKLGQHLFKKDQGIWGKPLITYDPERMDQVFSAIPTAESDTPKEVPPPVRPNDISVETEFYLMLHS